MVESIPGCEYGEVERREILLRWRGTLNRDGNEVLDTVSVIHRSHDPLSYVLFFPDGRDGWNAEMRRMEVAAASRKRSKVTPVMFYSSYFFNGQGSSVYFVWFSAIPAVLGGSIP